jgi:repressor LexA
MDNRDVFSRNLKYQMDLHNKSRQDVSEALGISYFTITSWVNGSKYPRMDKVEKLADYFGILMSDLIEDKKEEPTAQDDGLSEAKRKLIDKIKKLPEDQVQLLLQVAERIQ